jgi:hypothetical protein
MILSIPRSFCSALIAVCCSCVAIYAQPSLPKFEIKRATGEEGKSFTGKVSDFYNAIYQAPPYHYQTTKAAWDGYVASYIENPSAVVIVALVKDEIVAAIMGTPLKNASEKYRAAYAQRPEDLNSLFYLGELAVKQEYHRSHIRQALYNEFEKLVTNDKAYSGICIWEPLATSTNTKDQFWKRNGYKCCSDITFDELWAEDPNPGAPLLSHKMVCWKKVR